MSINDINSPELSQTEYDSNGCRDKTLSMSLGEKLSAVSVRKVTWVVVGVACFLSLLFLTRSPKITPGQVLFCSDKHIIGSLVNAATPGYEYRGILPMKIEGPDFVSAEVIESWSGGYFLNGKWMERSAFKSRLHILPTASQARDGFYAVDFIWPTRVESRIGLHAQGGVFTVRADCTIAR